MRPSKLRLLLASALLLTACHPAQAVETPPAAIAEAPTLVIEHVRLFDGTTWTEDATVWLAQETVLAIDPEASVPAGTPRVDGRGKTLLPGFIDAHTHVQIPAQLEQALTFGVTTEIDMFSLPQLGQGLRGEQARGAVHHRADYVSAGILATAPGGHGTEYGFEIPTISGPADAAAWVKARAEEGSEFIKVVYDDGSGYGRNLPTLSAETLAAVVAAAHAQGLEAVVHVSSQHEAIEALEAGADGLAHLFLDEAPSEAFVNLAAERDVFVTGTLPVLFAFCDGTRGAALADDSQLRPFLPPTEHRALVQGTGGRRAGTCAHALATAGALHRAGVTLLASTDAPNPGTVHGASMHDALALLVEAGLSPTDALRAATSAPAEAFELGDRGAVAPGLRADLVLVEGDPRETIAATRAIVGVWKAGERLDRDAVAKDVGAAWEAVEHARGAAAPAGLGDGLIADFQQAELEAKFGAGWQPSTDSMRGGKSEVELSVRDGKLELRGTIDEGALPGAWAGAMFFPGDRPMAPANLVSHPILRFRARGQGSMTVLAFASQLGFMPATRVVELSPEGADIEVDLRTLVADPYDITALFFGGAPVPGPFSFEIDDVRLTSPQ
jgi:imidazolonepropionase-like amidohydrolase